ncbi:hypothetical protein ACJMK2_023977 [Sinanodonta woodiana]|uniref:DBF4-type domain-containing protein n=1 Tax=Sinanodonta woodiana TaxID=1069815 RepID=A0ABD3T5W8_SINWO
MKKDTTTKHREGPKGKRKLEFCTKSKLSTVKLPLTGKTIYLDIKDNKTRRHLEEDLKKLGATVEEFLSKDLNYLVTSQPRPKDKVDNLHGPDSPAAVNTPSPFSCGVSPALTSTELQKVATVTRGRAIAERARLKANVSSVVENAEKWGVKIVSVEAAVKWIEKELKKLPKEETAKHISAKENQRHKHGIKIKKLQSPFLKFEALNQCYRPCHSQLEAWPRVNTDTRRGMCPFDGAGLAQDEPSREERGELVEAAQLDALILASPKEEQEGSFQGASTKISEDASLQFGGGRLITSRELRRRTEQKRRQERKRGYCECCNIKYEDLDKHVQEQQHWRFARDKKNFTSLDTLISSTPSTAEYLQKVLMGHIQLINVTRQPESDDDVDLIVENQVADDEQKSRDNSFRAEGIQFGQCIRGSPRLEKKRQNSSLVSATVEEKASSVASNSNRIDGREGILVHEKRSEMSRTEGRKSKRSANSGLCGTVVEVSMEMEKGPCVLEETGSDSKADADKGVSNEHSIKMESKDLTVIESVSRTNRHGPENDTKRICLTRKNVRHKMSPKMTITSLNSVKPPLRERQSKIIAEIRLQQNHLQDEDDDQCTVPLFSQKLSPTSKTVILDKQIDAYSSSCTHRVSKKSKLVELSNMRSDSKKMSEDKSIVDDHQKVHHENDDKSDEKNSKKEVDLIHENQVKADVEQRSSDDLCRNAEAKSNRYMRSIQSPRLERKRQYSALVTASVEEKASLPVHSDSCRIFGREHNIVHEKEVETLSQTEGRKAKRLANSSLCGTVVEAYIDSEKGPSVLEKSGFNSKPDADKAIFNEESFVKMECKELSVVQNVSGIGKPGLKNASKSICITRKDVGHKMSPKFTNTALNSVETPLRERQSKITAKLRLQQSFFEDEDEDDDESTFSLFSSPKSDMVTLAKENGAYSPSRTYRESLKSKLFELSNMCSDSKKISEEECTVYENQSVHHENKDKKNSNKDNLHTKGQTAKLNCYNAIRKKKGRQEVVNNKTKDSESIEHECEITKKEEESKCNTRLGSLTGQINGQIETMVSDENVDSVAMLNCHTEINPNQCEEVPSVTQKGSQKKKNGTLHQDKINNTDVHEDIRNNKGLFMDKSNNKDEDNIDNENYQNSFTEKTGRERRLVQKSRDNDLTFNAAGNVVVCDEFVSNLNSPRRRRKQEKEKDILKNTVDDIHNLEADLITEGISGHKVHSKEQTETRPLGGRDLKVDLNEATLIVDGKDDTGITKVIDELNDGSKTLDPLAVFISSKNTKSKDKIMQHRSKKNTTKQNGEKLFDRNIGVSKEFVQNSGTESSLDGITKVEQYSRSLKKEGLTQNKDSEIQIARPSGVKNLVNDGKCAFSKIEDKNKSARFDLATLVLHDKFKCIDFKVSSHFNAKGTIDSLKEISDKMEGSSETLIFRQSIAELAKLRRQNRSLLQNLEAKDDVISQVNSLVVDEASNNSQNCKKMLSQHSKHRSIHTNQRANKRSWLHSGRNGMCTATGIDKMELSANKVEALVLETDMWNNGSLSSAKSSTDCVRKLTKKDVSKRKHAMLISSPRKRKLVESDAVSTKLQKKLVHGETARSSQIFSEVTQKTYQEKRSQSPVFNKSPKLRHVTATQQLHTNDYYDTEMLSDTVIPHVQTDLCDFPHLSRSRITSERFTSVKTDENDRDIKLNLKRLPKERKVGCLIPNKVWTPRKSSTDVISSPKSGFSYSPRLETLRQRSRPKADNGQIVLSPGKSHSSPRSKKNLSKSFSDRIDESELEARQSLSQRINYADNTESLGGSTGSQKSLEEKRRTFRKVPDSKEQKYETHCSSDKSFENLTQQIKKKRKLDQFKFEIQGNRDNEGFPSARSPSRRPEKIKDCDSYQMKILDVQGSESIASQGSETVVNYKVNSQQSCLETSSRLVTLGKRGLIENVTNKADYLCASDVTKASVSNSRSKTKEKDKKQNVSIMDEARKSKSLKWSPAGFNVTGKKKVKLKRQWSLLSKRSAQAIFKDEDDRSSFAGFTEEEVSANLSLPSDMSFENCSEVSFDEKSHEDWVIDDEKKLESQSGTGNIVDFGQFLPAPFSSPGKHSSSSWDDACEDYLNNSIKHVTPLGKFWLQSPHKSPGKLSSGLLIGVPEDGSGPDSAIFTTPQKDRSRKNKNISVDVPSVEKIDDDIEFNYLSPQKMQSMVRENII